MAQHTEAMATATPAPLLALRLRQLNEVAAAAFPAALLTFLAAMVALVAVRSGVTTAIGQTVNGIEIGGVYALIAVGYTMVYGIIELINFAHGDVFTLSAFYAILLAQGVGAAGLDLNRLATSNVGGLLLALTILFPLTMVSAGITGVIIERVAYRRLRNAPRLAPLITAVGVSFVLEGLMFWRAGAADVRTGKEQWIHGTAFTVRTVEVQWNTIAVVVTAVLMMVALQTFVRFSRLGKAMRATAQDRDSALLCGIDINRTIAATFFIGSALAAAGALVYSLKEDRIVWNLGFNFGIIAFTAAVLGGIGNIVGAGLGGFLIGIITAFASQLLGGQWANSVVFAMLIVVLTFRPVGLLGMRVPDRA